MTEPIDHFILTGESPTTRGRFVDVSRIDPAEMAPGLRVQPILGEHTMVSFVSFSEHTQAPRHSHEEEQIAIVLEGEFEFELDGDVRTMRRGDVVVVPPWVPHSARTYGTRCLQMDVFNPPRKSLIEHAQAQAQAVAESAPKEDG